MVLVFDFGSQTCHLISRRIQDLGFEVLVVEPSITTEEIKRLNPSGIIFSGGPSSVYEFNAPRVNKEVLELGIPVLGICYGWQLIAQFLGGRVTPGKKEYGPKELEVSKPSEILQKVPKCFTVWLSHGDTVTQLPPTFEILSSTPEVQNAFCADSQRKIFGVQFHPEVEHTAHGKQILRNFCQAVCGLVIKKKKINIKKIVLGIKKEVGNSKVICAVSGGVDHQSDWKKSCAGLY